MVLQGVTIGGNGGHYSLCVLFKITACDSTIISINIWVKRSPSCKAENEQQMLEKRQVSERGCHFRLASGKLGSPMRQRVSVQGTESGLSCLSACGWHTC